MKKVIGVIIGIIIGLAIGVGGTYFILSNTFVSSSSITSKTTTKDGTSTETLDIYSDVVQSNFHRLFDFYSDCSDNASTYFGSSKINNTDIDNLTAFLVVASSFNDSKDSISVDAFNNKIIEYFGEDYEYDPTSFDATNICISHIYNSSTKKYDYRETACGCTSGPNSFTNYYISSAIKAGNQIILNVKLLVPGGALDLNSDGYVQYYSDINKTKKINLIFGSYYSDKTEAEPYNDYTNIQKGGNYKFVMTKNDSGTYSFSYSEYLDN